MQPDGPVVYSIDGSIAMYYITDHEWQCMMETSGPVNDVQCTIQCMLESDISDMSGSKSAPISGRSSEDPETGE
jgi:hypothetical protein